MKKMQRVFQGNIILMLLLSVTNLNMDHNESGRQQQGKQKMATINFHCIYYEIP